MTHDEVRWHAHRLTQRVKVTLVRDGDTETPFADDLEQLVNYGPDHASLDWGITDLLFGGYIHCRQMHATIARDWVRTVCRSIVIKR
jgi:hypothetical protein